MFNRKLKSRISELETDKKNLVNRIQFLTTELNRKVAFDSKKSFADLMRESLGIQVDFSLASTDKCLPPHYLDDMEEDERKAFVIHLESIHSDDKFQKVVRYFLNLFAMNTVYKKDPEEQHNSQIAVIVFRTFLAEFQKMHSEFLSYKKVEEEFDEHAVLPE